MRAHEFLYEDVENFPIANVRRANGAIGNQGVNIEQAADVLTHAAGMQVSPDMSMRQLVDALKADPAAQQRLRQFVQKNPITVSALPDGSYHLQDGHHRTFLLNLLGDETVPAVVKEGMAEGKQPGKPIIDAILNAMPIAQEIWFHGSRAIGKHRKNSDTDILVVVPDDLVGDQYLGVVRILQKLSTHFDNYDIQPTKAGTNIHRIAQEEGRLLWSNKQVVAEAPLADYQPIGDFDKPGPFRGADKKLIPHPVNQLKAQRFFEKTPYNFRLFFSNIPGTGKYSEYGIMDPDTVKIIFGDAGEQIVAGHENAITVVYVGNSGDSKVMLTPWMMAHRLGHAIQVGARGQMRNQQQPWKAGEDHFFGQVNSMLEEYYGKSGQRGGNLKAELTPEYNALFNAMGTQRSSRSGEIRRPYEFLYEIFAQYLGTGAVSFNALPTNLGYGRQAWGNPSRYLNIKPEYRDEAARKQAAEVLSYDMELMFNDALSNAEGKILVM